MFTCMHFGKWVHQAIHGRCVQVPPTWQAVRVAEQEDGISSRRRAGQGRRRVRGQQLLQAAEVGRLVADDRRVQRLCGRRAGWRDGLTSRQRPW